MLLQIIVTPSQVDQPPVSKTLSITLEDINDEPPIFNQTEYSSQILENIASGGKIGVVLAEDADLNTNIK